MEKQVKSLVVHAFSDAQRSFAAHHDARGMLIRAYQIDQALFWEHFIQALNRVLVAYARDPPVERLVEFVGAFAAAQSNQKEKKKGQASSRNICTTLLEYLIHHTKATSKSVRFRTTQLLSSIICHLPDDGELNANIWESLLAAILSRANDRLPRVRTAAIAGLCRLQDADEDGGPKKALFRLMSADSSSMVRRMALSSIAVDGDVVEHLISRTKDPKDDVRQAAYKALSKKVDPQMLSISTRVELIRRGRRDRSHVIRTECVRGMLCGGWLEGSCQGDIVQFCTLLDVETFHEDVIPTLVDIFRSSTDRRNQYEKIIDLNELSVETAAILVALLKSSKNAWDVVENILPSTISYVDALKYYKDNFFILQCLLRIASYLDLSDEAGRRAITQTIRSDFLEDASTPIDLYPLLLSALGASVGSLENAGQIVVELLAEVTLTDDIDYNIGILQLIRAMLSISPRCTQPQVLYSSPMTSIVLPALASPDEELRGLALQCLSLYCILDRTEQTALCHVLLFVQACENDTLSLRVIALETMVDFLMLYDLSEKGDDNGVTYRQTLSSTILGYLSSADSELRTVAGEGIAKLLFSARIQAEPSILVRLIMLLFNPVTADDHRLRQCLSVLFPAFACALAQNRLCIEESFMHVIDTLVQAPSSSPLHRIDPLHIAQFMLSLTQPTTCTLQPRRPAQDAALVDVASQIHYRLAMVLLNGILDALEEEIDSAKATLYCKILGSIHIGDEKDRLERLTELNTLTDRVTGRGVKDIKSRPALTALKRFSARVSALVEANDKENRPISGVTDKGVDILVRKTEALSISSR